MALTDLIKPHPGADRPSGFTCPKYTRGEGKRCVHYLVNGGCALPDEFMCVEWMKANRQGPAAPSVATAAEPSQQRTAAPQQHDLFGPPQVLPVAEPPTALRPEEPKRPIDPVPLNDLEPLRGLTAEDIESFKALGVEVCLRSQALGEVWLVPERTGQPRKEITPELAATIVRVTSAFPGSAVVALNSTHEPAGSQKEEAAP